MNGFGFIPNNFRRLNSSNKGSSSGSPPAIPPKYPPSNNNLNNDCSPNDDDGDYAGLFTKFFLDDADEEEKEEDPLSKSVSAHHKSNFITCNDISDTVSIRGGSDDIVAGTKSTLKTTSNYWSDFFSSVQSTITAKFKNFNPFSNQSKRNANDNSIEDDNDVDISTIPVEKVEAPKSTILPNAIIRSAGQRSGLTGSVMRSDKVQKCAQIVRSWYMKRGYVLHSVTGATLHADNGTATLNVVEPKSSDLPLDIRFAKMVPIDPETGETTTMRKYKQKLEGKRGRAFKAEEWTKIKSSLNSTLVEAKGRTNPRTLSKRLGLKSGDHFRWDGRLWQNIANSGIFTKIWRANPVRLEDGSVQVQVLAEESPSKNLEYGIQKSLYTGNWVSKYILNLSNLAFLLLGTALLIIFECTYKHKYIGG